MMSSAPCKLLHLGTVGRHRIEWSGLNGEIARIFGLAEASAPPILGVITVPGDGITLIRGFSGTGKSTLLRQVCAARPEARQLGPAPDGRRTPIELMHGTLAERIRSLGRFGLGEATAMITPAGKLSVGQRHRLQLAMLLDARPRVVAIDEFLSGLDETTAAIVAHNFQRLCRRDSVTAYIASAQAHILEALGPDHVVTLDFHGHARVETDAAPAPRIAALDELWVGPGSASEMRSLSRFHYETDASIDWRDTRVGIRIAKLDGQVVGGAVYGPPLPAACDSIPILAEINRCVVALIRTIVHPTLRGAGLTRHLLPPVGTDVRLLSTVSALGKFIPFHVRHGFELVDHPRNVRRPSHHALERELHALGETDIAPLYDRAYAQTLWDRLSPNAAGRLGEAVRSVLIEDNVQTCAYLAGHAGLAMSAEEERQVQAIFSSALANVPPEGFGFLLSEAIYFPMQGAIKRLR